MALSEQVEEDFDSKINVRSLMDQIRANTAREVGERSDGRLSFDAYRGNFNNKRKAGEILHSEQLRYLNENYHYSQSNSLTEIASHRKGIVGRIIEKFKRKLALLVWEGVLKNYFEREKQFQTQLVRLLNDQARYIDERDAAAFWELVHKVDVDLSKALDRTERLQDEYVSMSHSMERRLHDSLNSELLGLAKQVASLRADLATQNSKLDTVSSVAEGLESVVSRLSKRMPAISALEKSEENTLELEPHSGFDYLLLENRFRGSEELISERLAIYVDEFKNVLSNIPNRKVLEIGCGRGELLTLFKEAGVPAFGVDLDPEMIEAAKSRGVDATHQDGFKALSNVEEDSLSGVIAIQVIEHLTPAKVRELIDLSYRKLATGGKLIFETINPRSLLALSSNYFRDPTHVFPQHPDTVAYAMSLSGFQPVDIKYLSKVPEEALLKKIKHEEYMTPQWHFFVDRMNANIEQLNELLYGYQDFAVIGVKK